MALRALWLAALATSAALVSGAGGSVTIAQEASPAASSVEFRLLSGPDGALAAKATPPFDSNAGLGDTIRTVLTLDSAVTQAPTITIAGRGVDGAAMSPEDHDGDASDDARVWSHDWRVPQGEDKSTGEAYSYTITAGATSITATKGHATGATISSPPAVDTVRPSYEATGNALATATEEADNNGMAVDQSTTVSAQPTAWLYVVVDSTERLYGDDGLEPSRGLEDGYSDPSAGRMRHDINFFASDPPVPAHVASFGDRNSLLYNYSHMVTESDPAGPVTFELTLRDRAGNTATVTHADLDAVAARSADRTFGYRVTLETPPEFAARFEDDRTIVLQSRDALRPSTVTHASFSVSTAAGPVALAAVDGAAVPPVPVSYDAASREVRVRLAGPAAEGAEHTVTPAASVRNAVGVFYDPTVPAPRATYTAPPTFSGEFADPRTIVLRASAAIEASTITHTSISVSTAAGPVALAPVDGAAVPPVPVSYDDASREVRVRLAGPATAGGTVYTVTPSPSVRNPDGVPYAAGGVDVEYRVNLASSVEFRLLSGPDGALAAKATPPFDSNAGLGDTIRTVLTLDGAVTLPPRITIAGRGVDGAAMSAEDHDGDGTDDARVWSHDWRVPGEEDASTGEAFAFSIVAGSPPITAAAGLAPGVTVSPPAVDTVRPSYEATGNALATATEEADNGGRAVDAATTAPAQPTSWLYVVVDSTERLYGDDGLEPSRGHEDGYSDPSAGRMRHDINFFASDPPAPAHVASFGDRNSLLYNYSHMVTESDPAGPVTFELTLRDRAGNTATVTHDDLATVAARSTNPVFGYRVTLETPPEFAAHFEDDRTIVLQSRDALRPSTVTHASFSVSTAAGPVALAAVDGAAVPPVPVSYDAASREVRVRLAGPAAEGAEHTVTPAASVRNSAGVAYDASVPAPRATYTAPPTFSGEFADPRTIVLRASAAIEASTITHTSISVSTAAGPVALAPVDGAAVPPVPVSYDDASREVRVRLAGPATAGGTVYTVTPSPSVRNPDGVPYAAGGVDVEYRVNLASSVEFRLLSGAAGALEAKTVEPFTSSAGLGDTIRTVLTLDGAVTLPPRITIAGRGVDGAAMSAEDHDGDGTDDARVWSHDWRVPGEEDAFTGEAFAFSIVAGSPPITASGGLAEGVTVSPPTVDTVRPSYEATGNALATATEEADNGGRAVDATTTAPAQPTAWLYVVVDSTERLYGDDGLEPSRGHEDGYSSPSEGRIRHDINFFASDPPVPAHVASFGDRNSLLYNYSHMVTESDPAGPVTFELTLRDRAGNTATVTHADLDAVAARSADRTYGYRVTLETPPEFAARFEDDRTIVLQSRDALRPSTVTHASFSVSTAAGPVALAAVDGAAVPPVPVSYDAASREVRVRLAGPAAEGAEHTVTPSASVRNSAGVAYDVSVPAPRATYISPPTFTGAKTTSLTTTVVMLSGALDAGTTAAPQWSLSTESGAMKRTHAVSLLRPGEHSAGEGALPALDLSEGAPSSTITLVHAGLPDTAATPSVTYDGTGTMSAGGSVRVAARGGGDPVHATDGAAPGFTARTTARATTEVAFSEPVLGYTAASEWTLDGIRATRVDGMAAASLSEATSLTLTHVPFLTDAEPTVVYSGTGGARGASLRAERAHGAPMAATDGTPPAVTGSAYSREGNMDRIVLAFSEGLDGSTAVAGNFEVYGVGADGARSAPLGLAAAGGFEYVAGAEPGDESRVVMRLAADDAHVSYRIAISPMVRDTASNAYVPMDPDGDVTVTRGATAPGSG